MNRERARDICGTAASMLVIAGFLLFGVLVFGFLAARIVSEATGR